MMALGSSPKGSGGCHLGTLQQMVISSGIVSMFLIFFGCPAVNPDPFRRRYRRVAAHNPKALLVYLGLDYELCFQLYPCDPMAI